MSAKEIEVDQYDFIEKCLWLAVPMWLTEHKNKPDEWLMDRKDLCAKVIAEKGDIILYRSKHKGDSAEAFNYLAEGIAILLLSVNHPVPFGKLVFFPDGKTKLFETKKEANDFVFRKKG